MTLLLTSLLSALFLSPALLSQSDVTSSAMKDVQVEEAFAKYIEQFNKTYEAGSKEYFDRIKIFKGSLERISWLNTHREHANSAMYGLTTYSDMSSAEFQATILAGRSSNSSRSTGRGSRPRRSQRRPRHVYANSLLAKLPEDFPRRVDWRDKKAVSAIHNQGKCGACWAYSIVETVESMVSIRSGAPVQELSVQQIIDCADDNNHGCDGGDTCTALQWMTENQVKIQSLEDYPISEYAEKCKAMDPPTGIVVANYTCNDYVSDETEMLKRLAYHGPLATAVDATSWQDYLGGVVQFHCETNRNHAVQVVGFDLTGEVPYYIVRNTWGTAFGIDGYLYVAVGKNLCAIAEEVSSLDLANVSRD